MPRLGSRCSKPRPPPPQDPMVPQADLLCSRGLGGGTRTRNPMVPPVRRCIVYVPRNHQIPPRAGSTSSIAGLRPGSGPMPNTQAHVEEDESPSKRPRLEPPGGTSADPHALPMAGGPVPEGSQGDDTRDPGAPWPRVRLRDKTTIVAGGLPPEWCVPRGGLRPQAVQDLVALTGTISFPPPM